jgi:hypothetical protein
VSTFPNARGAAFDETWRRGYLDLARERAADGRFHSELAQNGDLEVLVVSIEGAQVFNQRYLCRAPSGQIFQVDYILPNDLREPMAPAVASSIGALRAS